MLQSFGKRFHGWLKSAASPAPVGSLDVTVYSRQNCCLCDQAEQILRDHGLCPRVVDIDQDSQLRERYTTCVPVVVIDGKERFRGRIDPALLRRLLR